MKFEELDLHPSLLESIGYMGFVDATPVQEQAIPIILKQNDVIACAQTGTGKTAAFLLPVIDYILRQDNQATRVLIVVPTRELAMQIDQQVEGITYGLGITSIAIYGGTDGSNWDDQKRALSDGADIIIATPGKLLSHLSFGYVNLENLKFFILDEADRMLDIGFHDDVLKIMENLPEKRQNLMFSATMAPKIREFAKKILTNPEEVSLAVSKPAEGVLQAAYLAYDNQKIDLIIDLLKDKPEYASVIIFCATKKTVSEVYRSLKKKEFNVERISSDLDQTDREEILRNFKARNIRILVATDVISRGIDIKSINLVMNYNVPREPADYVHRVGRTARADTTGVAITLINQYEMREFAKIEELIEASVIKVQPPKHLGEGPTWNPKAKSGGRRNFGKRR